jgi:sterol O-acyltransferase
MHSISLLMKMHSYASRNSYFHQLDLKSHQLRSQLKKSEDSAIQTELDEIEGELQPEEIRYPNNFTWKNWIDWLLVPTFVYELYYPRTAQ